MHVLARRLPDADWLHRNRGAILGLAAGIFGPLLLAAFVTVVYTGHGLWETPPKPPVVYPNW